MELAAGAGVNNRGGNTMEREAGRAANRQEPIEYLCAVLQKQRHTDQK